MTWQMRFVYEGGVFGEWTDLVADRSLFPNAAYAVSCVEHRVIGPDGQQASAGRQPRHSKKTNRAPRVPNGAAS